MGSNQENIEVFKIEATDVEYLFDKSGIRGNKLSTLTYKEKEEKVYNPSESFQKLVESPSFNRLANNLLEPILKIEFNRGGGATANEVFYLLYSDKNKEVLVQFINSEMDFLFLLFENFNGFLEWWINIYASNNPGEYKTVFPGIMETEVLMCSLQCIDLYHRSYMESMLSYDDKLNLSINTSEFIELMKRALASKDKRWLLPTLFEITPGLKNSNIMLKPEHIDKIEELGFLEKNDSLLTLDERSRLMGTEFITSFMGATGFQATTLIKEREVSLSKVFLATTAFTNHLFSFEEDTKGISRFRHSSYDADKLKSVLEKWFNSLLKTIKSHIPDKKIEDHGNEEKKRFCINCGSKIVEGNKFCTECGNRI